MEHTLRAAEISRAHVLENGLDALLETAGHVGTQEAELDIKTERQKNTTMYSHLGHTVIRQVVTRTRNVGGHVWVPLSDHLLFGGRNADQTNVRMVFDQRRSSQVHSPLL